MKMTQKGTKPKVWNQYYRRDQCPCMMWFVGLDICISLFSSSYYIGTEKTSTQLNTRTQENS